MGPARLLADGLARSLTLLRVFVYASAALLLAAAIILASTLTQLLWNQAVSAEQHDAARFVNTVLAGDIVTGNRIVIDGRARRALERGMQSRRDLIGVKVWGPDGTLLWASHDDSRVGKRYALDQGVVNAVASGETRGHVEKLGSDAESGAEAMLADEALEVYTPVLGASGHAIGAYELYVSTADIERAVADGVTIVWVAVGSVFLGLEVLLIALVRGASRRMRRQTEALRSRSTALMESYRKLEESSLEAIESLNATVEAKDPYTAGHSQRVRQIAIEIGRELGLQRDRLDTLATSALFHDIGKLAVPDAILTKPARLTPEEFEIVKEHAAKGAEIVGKLSRLAPAMPAIRHHHERWDGRGYPDGLEGDQIPLEAAIVGLADAWDAMTTERPYAPALPLVEAFAQVREGRETQFNPVVVDAFLAVSRRSRGRVAELTPHAAAAG